MCFSKRSELVLSREKFSLEPSTTQASPFLFRFGEVHQQQRGQGADDGFPGTGTQVAKGVSLCWNVRKWPERGIAPGVLFVGVPRGEGHLGDELTTGGH